jgi:hypothetical protein
MKIWLGQYKPRWLRLISSLDNVCYRSGAPHVLDILLGLLLVMTAATIVRWLI